MIMTCELCGNHFLTEADPYVIQNTPQGHKYYCSCVIKENINGSKMKQMNDKDEKAYDIWRNSTSTRLDIHDAWQAACEYVRGEFKFQTPPAVAIYQDMNDKLQAENKKLRDALEHICDTTSDYDSYQFAKEALQE